MRFGSRDTVGLSTANANLHPSSLWLPTPVDPGPIAGSARTAAAVVASATPHTKGSYVTVIAATAADATVVNIRVAGAIGVSGANSSSLLDVAIGAAASEVVIIPDIPVGYQGLGTTWSFPVVVPAGSRIACRCQSATVSKSLSIQIDLSQHQPGGVVPTSLVNYTVTAATSLGVVVTAPGGTNTKGAWTELVASSTALQAILVLAQSNGNTAAANGSQTVDIGIGGAGSETVISGLNDLYFIQTSTESMASQNSTQPIPVNIPAGSRLSARYQTSTLTNSIDVAVVGVPK